MKTKLWNYILLFALVGWVAACDDDDNGKRSLNDTDENFIEKAALGNMTEIEFGEIAASKGNDSLVRAFGQMMVNEHTAAQNELENIANDYTDIDWPDDVDEQHQEIRNQLMELEGYSFDSLYMHSQVMDHEMTIDLFENEIANGTEERVTDYAEKYLPHIEAHFEKADSIENVIIAAQPQGN